MELLNNKLNSQNIDTKHLFIKYTPDRKKVSEIGHRRAIDRKT
jgi:hypothetical protein